MLARSIASSSSSSVTEFFSRRAASSAASFTTFSRSAPVKPGVREAIVRSCTSGSSATPRAWTRRISSRPRRSGRSTTTCRSNRPGRDERRVQDVGTVRGGHDDDALRRVEAVHLDQQLVQRLLALVVRAEACAHRAAATLADRVDLVQEHQRGRLLLRLLEQLADARGAQADEHLDELRAGHEEERDVRLPGDGASEQRLAASRRTEQQHALRDAPAEPLVLLRVLQEVDDLAELFLRLVDAGHVVEAWSSSPCGRRS